MRAVAILLFGALVSAGILLARREAAHPPEAASGAPQDPALEDPALRVKPAVPGDLVRDVALVDQDGRPFRLSDLRGQVVVLTFIYSHCNMPLMCPLTSSKIVAARDLAKKRGLSGVQFLLVSFDSAGDPPARLREYSRQYTSDLSSLRFATGDAAGVEKLCNQLNTYFRKESPSTYEHNIVVSIIGRDGVLRDDLFGNQWPAEELVSAVERVTKAP